MRSILHGVRSTSGSPSLPGYRLYSMTVQATLEGMGVALGHAQLIAPHLKRGTLVALFEPPVAAPARYFLAVAPGTRETPEVWVFLDWLRAETRPTIQLRLEPEKNHLEKSGLSINHISLRLSYRTCRSRLDMKNVGGMMSEQRPAGLAKTRKCDVIISAERRAPSAAVSVVGTLVFSFGACFRLTPRMTVRPSRSNASN